MLLIALCDDDRFLSEKMGAYITELAQEEKISCEIKLFSDGKDLLESVRGGTLYDIIFLDIEMRYMDGLEAAREIRKIDKTALILYVSSHSKYALEAYDVRPFQFLVKPFEKQQLKNYFQAAVQEILAEDAYFRYYDDKQSFKLPLGDILYFESEVRNVKIVLPKEVRVYREKLNHVEKTLDQAKVEFWRIHQSYLVNRRHIYRTRYTEVELSDGTVLPISEGRRKYIREKYLEVMTRSMIE